MKEKVVLKSAHPELYGDLEIECMVIPNSQIGAFLETIPAENSITAHKSAPVIAREGVEGEEVVTTLKTTVDGKEYIYSEVKNHVSKRVGSDGVERMDVVVTNPFSTSNESYVVKGQKFGQIYTPCEGGYYMPVPEVRTLTRVDEPVLIETSWGELALCLAGSYIVTYDAESCDYNTIEAGAFNSTYTVDEPNVTLKRK